jgi:hypothetical protein
VREILIPRIHGMMRCISGALLTAIALCCLARPMAAQVGLDSGSASSSLWHVGVFAGGASSTMATSSLGVTPGRQLAFLGLEASTPVLRVAWIRVAYAAQLLPIVALSGRSAPLGYYDAGSFDASGGPANTGVVPGPYRTYAVGIVPFGLEATSSAVQRVSVFGAIAAGGLLFQRPVPVPEANRINFTLEFGGGLRVCTTRERWIQLGWKHHHLSNAYLAHYNPGVDANVFYAGYEWTARLPR